MKPSNGIKVLKSWLFLYGGGPIRVIINPLVGFSCFSRNLIISVNVWSGGQVIFWDTCSTDFANRWVDGLDDKF